MTTETPKTNAVSMKITEAKCTNVNLGCEGSEDNPTSRTDLNFEGLAERSVMAKLLGCDFEKVAQFWNSENQIQFLGITAINSRAELTDCSMKFLKNTVNNVKVKKFSFTPIGGAMIKIKLQVQVHHTDKQLAMFDKWQKKVDVLDIETNQADLFTSAE